MSFPSCWPLFDAYCLNKFFDLLEISYRNWDMWEALNNGHSCKPCDIPRRDSAYSKCCFSQYCYRFYGHIFPLVFTWRLFSRLFPRQIQDHCNLCFNSNSCASSINIPNSCITISRHHILSESHYTFFFNVQGHCNISIIYQTATTASTSMPLYWHEQLQTG